MQGISRWQQRLLAFMPAVRTTSQRKTPNLVASAGSEEKLSNSSNRRCQLSRKQRVDVENLRRAGKMVSNRISDGLFICSWPSLLPATKTACITIADRSPSSPSTTAFRIPCHVQQPLNGSASRRVRLGILHKPRAGRGVHRKDRLQKYARKQQHQRLHAAHMHMLHMVMCNSCSV